MDLRGYTVLCPGESDLLSILNFVKSIKRKIHSNSNIIPNATMVPSFRLVSLISSTDLTLLHALWDEFQWAVFWALINVSHILSQTLGIFSTCSCSLTTAREHTTSFSCLPYSTWQRSLPRGLLWFFFLNICTLNHISAEPGRGKFGKLQPCRFTVSHASYAARAAGETSQTVAAGKEQQRNH